MAEKSAIEWTDATWNPVTGCTKVSPACANCYIERTPPFRVAGKRFVKGHIPLAFHEDRLTAPLKRKAPTMYFVNSLSDLFHEDIPDAFIAEVFGVMAVCGAREPDGPDDGTFSGKYSPERLWYDQKGPHTFQVLTKRPARMHALMTSPTFREAIADAAYRRAHNQRYAGYLAHQIGAREEYGRCYEPGRMWPLSNVWLGVSVENQHFADGRIPLLLQTPASVRFLSCEPLLGPITFRWAKWDDGTPSPRRATQLPSVQRGGGRTIAGSVDHLDGLRMLDWVIVGGESGPRLRPTDPAWVRQIRDQCVEAGVPFFFKQWGGRTAKSGGRILDGRTWDEMPGRRRSGER